MITLMSRFHTIASRVYKVFKITHW